MCGGGYSARRTDRRSSPEGPISLFPHPERKNPARDGDHEGGSSRLSGQDSHEDEDGGKDKEEPAER
jgi:hypothetical protein